jgi:hypothetical protein
VGNAGFWVWGAGLATRSITDSQIATGPRVDPIVKALLAPTPMTRVAE